MSEKYMFDMTGSAFMLLSMTFWGLVRPDLSWDIIFVDDGLLKKHV